MKWSLLFLAALACADPALASPPDAASVETQSGYKVVLSGVSAERQDGGDVVIHGWARREAGRVGLINAHLHVEAFAEDGQSLGVTEGRWRGALSVRDRSAAPFSVPIAPPIADAAARYLVLVVPYHQPREARDRS